jgi:hypothetical protein
MVLPPIDYSDYYLMEGGGFEGYGDVHIVEVADG